ncbi:MAG: hypothetical protein FWC45_07470, partial [Treponema sp.]|nr:hypothetical protein [Treponema sp.]
DRLCDKLALPTGRGFVLSPLYFISAGNVSIFFSSILKTPKYRFFCHRMSRICPAKGGKGCSENIFSEVPRWRRPDRKSKPLKVK